MEHGYRALAQALMEGKTVWRVTTLDGPSRGKVEQGTGILFLREPVETVPSVRDADGAQILVERLTSRKTLLICGGGHISEPVSRLGKLLGYTVIVVDDRPEFAAPARFPAAHEVACMEFTQLPNAPFWTEAADLSVVIVTRGHVADLVCLREALRHETEYVGMIGSHKKNRAVFDVLRAEGMTDAQLAQVHAPIGLDIGAETPEEIAVCIAAELIVERRRSANAQFSQAMLCALADGCGGIMATVVRKAGSAPRGVGARLLMQANGHALGTVGGGLAEHEVMQTARALLAQPAVCMRHFDMNNGEAGKSGLICGGAIDVLFEVVD